VAPENRPAADEAPSATAATTHFTTAADGEVRQAADSNATSAPDGVGTTAAIASAPPATSGASAQAAAQADGYPTAGHRDRTSAAPVPTPLRGGYTPAAVTVTPRERVFITITVMLASVMQALDNTIANVALPHIQGSLSATQDQMTWVLTSYILAAAIMTPLSGWFAAQFGRRRVFLISMIGFTIASALCGVAQSLNQIVLARLLQGACGASLVPMSQAFLLDINPPHRHARAMAIWVMAITLGPILGPGVGGWLTENYDWRWVFYINVPVGILSVIGAMTFLSETPLNKTRFDFFGFAALSLFVGALQLLLDRGPLQDWFDSTEIWIEASIAVVCLYLFLVHALTTRSPPFVNPNLFKDRNFLVGSIFIFVVGAVMFATLSLLPPMLQGLMNYPVVLTGLVTAPRGVGTLTAMVIVDRLAGKVDTRLILTAGFIVSAVSLGEMTGYYLQMDTWTVMWTGYIQGLGSGLVYVPLAAVSFATLATSRRNEGTALFALMRNIGASIGISVITAMLTRNTQVMHSRLAENVTPYLNPLHQAPATTTKGLAMLNQLVTAQASMIAYNNAFKMMMIVTLLALPLVALVRKAEPDPNAEPVVVE
jgi:DHA2 family multidrug resistance protein